MLGADGRVACRVRKAGPSLVQRGGVEDDKVWSSRDWVVAVLLMETGKSRGGAGLGPGDDEFILKRVDPDLLTVGYFG